MSPSLQRLDVMQLFDTNDKPCGTVRMSPKTRPDAPPREVVWMGRRFREGGPDSYYKENQMGEIAK